MRYLTQNRSERSRSKTARVAYYYFKAYCQDGTWERIHDLVRKQVGVKHGKQHH